MAGASEHAQHELGDFTTTTRVLYISLLAVPIGILSAFVALALLRLIGFFTNLFFFQRIDFTLLTPSHNQLGWLEIFVPMIGGLIVGFMAKYGSDKIRGHGIPEAIESILMNGSRVEPKVAVLKPVSAAVAIGSGGPFGAEGPIIMTGGAVGSIIAQVLQLTSAERKTLLAAGAAGGMTAVFNTPVAAVLLAFELLLFEWKPRSIIPVAVASFTATGVRSYLLGTGPLFPVPPHPVFIGPLGMAACVLAGVLAGALAAVLTLGVYASEDAFRKLPIHWMWWPVIGGLVIGAGGLVFPQALGVGYDVIGTILQGNVALNIIWGILIVKSIIWAVSLGSGTSGGVVAPVLMMGAALGALEGHFLPYEGLGFWALLGMAATLGAIYRAPFTCVVFALELTHDVNSLLPLLITVFMAYGVSVLIMRRSILTEKIARRGYHVSSEYATDPMQILFVREVMRTNVIALPSTTSIKDLAVSLRSSSAESRGVQRLYPVIDEHRGVCGVVTRSDVQQLLQRDGESSNGSGQGSRLADVVKAEVLVAYPDEPLTTVMERMAETNITRFPVVEHGPERKLLGMVALTDLLKATQRHLEEETRRERVLRTHLMLPFRARRVVKTAPVPENAPATGEPDAVLLTQGERDKRRLG